MNIKFVNYTGSYPNLCRGVLTLNINGQITKFGHNISSYNWSKGRYEDDYYEPFWTSGGCVRLDDDGNYQSETANWELKYNVDATLPEWLKPYKEQLLEVFNANVRHGCCGGCI